MTVLEFPAGEWRGGRRKVSRGLLKCASEQSFTSHRWVSAGVNISLRAAVRAWILFGNTHALQVWIKTVCVSTAGRKINQRLDLLKSHNHRCSIDQSSRRWYPRSVASHWCIYGWWCAGWIVLYIKPQSQSEHRHSQPASFGVKGRIITINDKWSQTRLNTKNGRLAWDQWERFFWAGWVNRSWQSLVLLG